MGLQGVSSLVVFKNSKASKKHPLEGLGRYIGRSFFFPLWLVGLFFSFWLFGCLLLFFSLLDFF